MRASFAWTMACVLFCVAGCPQPDSKRPGDTPLIDQGPPPVEPGRPGTTTETATPPEAPAKRPPNPHLSFSPCCTGLPETGMWKCDPAFADVNGDGHLDMAALPRLGSGPRVWMGDGQGHWTESSTGLDPGAGSCGGGMGFADANGDGHLDLVVADHCQGVFVYLGDGDGKWELVTRSLYPSDLAQRSQHPLMYEGAEDLDVGDVNGDGRLDLLVGGSDESGINVYLGDGTGRNWSRVDAGLPEKDWAVRVLLSDLNGDDRLDIVASYSDGPRAWFNDGQGGWTPASRGLPTPMVGGIYGGLAAGDVNEDGRVDIAVANWVDGPEVYLQQADGSWEKTPDVFPDMTGGATSLALGDIDRDGHLDMIVAGRLHLETGVVRGVFALRGDGRGGWTFEENTGLPETGLLAMGGVSLADINGDGLLDVAAGTGLLVETSAPQTPEPALPWRLIIWCTSRPSPSASASQESQ